MGDIVPSGMFPLYISLHQIALVLWEQSYDESHYTYHIHENLPGWLLVLLRVALAMMIGTNLRYTTSEERSVLKKDFYHSFAIVSQSRMG